jgi:N-acetylmuramoyl-L-alanine amidase
MVKRLLALALVAVVAAPANAALTVQALYADAMAKENAVREALSDQSTSETVLKALRTAVAAYESLVRRYPTSSYSDNALWQAARLSLDGFVRFGQPQDRDAGIRLLKALASEYPGSKLASQVPEQLAAAAKASPAPPMVAKSREAPESGADRTPSAQAKPKAAGPAPVREVAATRGIEPSSPRRIATISGIRRTVMPEVVRVIIDVDSEVEFHDERISGPSRIFVDFQSTRTMSTLVEQTIRFDRDNDVVRQVRVGRHPNSTTRVVLDATGVSSYSVYPLYSPYRLVIDCIRETPQSLRASAPTAPPIVPASVPTPSVVQRPQPVGQTAAVVDLESRRVTGPAGRLAASAPRATGALEEARAQPLASRAVATGRTSRLPNVAPGATAAIQDSYPGPLPSRRLAPGWGRQLPSVAPLIGPSAAMASTDGAGTATVTLSDAASVASPPPVAAVPSKPAGPTPNTHPGVSMARQLGLGVSRIVIDPGHGGHDPGAKGRGITEAELVLDVALRLEKLLEENHSFEVILTRRADDFIPLPERTAIANREGADLFLSIHANASPNAEARGIETYFLNFASNQSAAAVAARENSGSGQAMGALPDFVKAIALNNKLDESKDFATLVQHSMLEQLRGPNKTIKDLGVKQAPFVVLIGASMPSVLAEISFLTNPQELKLLKSNAYRQRIAEALSGAIAKYQKSLAGAPAVAKQR